MTKKIIVLFHSPESDIAKQLNLHLKNKNGYVDQNNRVAAVQFPDGWLIVCYDDKPDTQIEQAIEDKIKNLQPEKILLLVHGSTWRDNPEIRSAQEELTWSGNVLEKAEGPYYYSHEMEDDAYGQLVHLLSHSHLDELVQTLNKKTIASDFALLKHRLGHVFSPIDIDLQGLAESGFNPDYMREVANAYRAEENENHHEGARQPDGLAAERQASKETPDASQASGKAVASLQLARELIYTGSPSISKIITAMLDEADEDTIQREVIESAWGMIEGLLPEKGAPSDDIFTILSCMETEAGLKKLKARFEAKDQYYNSFHQWLISLDETLNQLRRVLSIQRAKDLNA
jgi:hypothetical protein